MGLLFMQEMMELNKLQGMNPLSQLQVYTPISFYNVYVYLIVCVAFYIGLF